MIFSMPLDEVVKSRKSIRTYSDQSISQKTIEQIKNYIEGLTSPFPAKVSFKLISKQNTDEKEKLGTYGMIKGATHYIGSTVSPAELSLEALGYQFEQLILYVTTLGLGTCWLGGTFQKGQFAKLLEVKGDEIFPAVSPLGYPTEKERIAGSLIRFTIKADKRKPWKDLFYNGDFSTPLSEADAGEYAFALEMLRQGPSASNKQPWRIVKTENAYHFYENQIPGYSRLFDYDIARIDMGIAACHFHLAAIEKNCAGAFIKLAPPDITPPENIHYAFSWVI